MILSFPWTNLRRVLRTFRGQSNPERVEKVRLQHLGKDSRQHWANNYQNKFPQGGQRHCHCPHGHCSHGPQLLKPPATPRKTPSFEWHRVWTVHENGVVSALPPPRLGGPQLPASEGGAPRGETSAEVLIHPLAHPLGPLLGTPLVPIQKQFGVPPTVQAHTLHLPNP